MRATAASLAGLLALAACSSAPLAQPSAEPAPVVAQTVAPAPGLPAAWTIRITLPRLHEALPQTEANQRVLRAVQKEVPPQLDPIIHALDGTPSGARLAVDLVITRVELAPQSGEVASVTLMAIFYDEVSGQGFGRQAFRANLTHGPLPASLVAQVGTYLQSHIPEPLLQS